MAVKVREEVVRTEFVIVGGGLGGLQAAIDSAQKGLDTLVVEKADTRRSGCGANGNDHFACYIPECHGDFERAVREVGMTMDGGPWQDMCMLRTWLGRSFEVVQMWEEFGINMRPTGKWNFEGHSLPGNQRYHLKFDGYNQKQVLTDKAKEFGAKIMNKTMITELLTNDQGRVIGAIGINTSADEPEVVLFEAKSVLLAPGMASRVYPGITPAYMFNLPCCPAVAGSGHALSYRAGAKLVNMDILQGHAGPKYFARGGKGTWIGVSSTVRGECVAPYNTKPSRETGDVVADVWPSVYRDKMLDGTGPTFMNCTELSDEDMDFMLHSAFVSEGIDSITDYLEQYHIDLKEEMIEFGSYNPTVAQRGVETDEHAATSVPGLYAAGDCTGNASGSVTGAVVFGMIAGESAAEYVKNVDYESVEGHPLVAERVQLYSEMMDRTEGAHWKEAASTLQNIMNEYAGLSLKSQDIMSTGLEYLHQLKEYSLRQMAAENAHELMRSLEILDMIDVGESIIYCGMNRKESRGPHKRVDYTYTNLLLNNKYQTIYKKGEEVVMEYRNRR
ncbi:MAG: FAD-binding protein [Clostridiales bacterium]|nr:FAD-binding protein [Clostridiales bacterium]